MQRNRHPLALAASLSIATILGLAGQAAAQSAQPNQSSPPIQPSQPGQPGAPGQGAAPGGVPASVITPPGQAAVPPATGTLLSLDSTSVDLGVITDEKPVESMIKFKNAGPSPMEIKKITGSCGCTVPALKDLTKTVFQPGEGGEIKVVYNPHGRNGKQNTKVTIETNDPTKPSTIVDIFSEVKPLVRVDPLVANLGQVMRGTNGKTTIKVISRIPDLQVLQAVANSPRVTATVLPAVQTEVNGEKITETPIEVSLADNVPLGNITDNLTIRTSDTTRTLNIYAMGEVVGGIEAKPQQIQFAGVAGGGEIRSLVRLSSRTGKAFKILGVEEVPGTGAPLFKIETSEDTAVNPPVQVITVVGTAPAVQGPVRGELVVKTDSPEDSEVRLRYFGYVRANTPNAPAQSPAWQSSPSSLIPPQ